MNLLDSHTGALLSLAVMQGLEEWLSPTEPGLMIDSATFIKINTLYLFFNWHDLRPISPLI